MVATCVVSVRERWGARQTIEARHGLEVACLAEIAYNQDWLSAAQLAREAEVLNKIGYGQYLKRLLRQEEGQ